MLQIYFWQVKRTPLKTATKNVLTLHSDSHWLQMQLQCWRACCELVSLGVTLKTCKEWAGGGTWDAQMPSDAAAYTLSFLFLLFPLLEQIFPCWYKRVAQPPDAWALISIVGVKYACLICRHLHRCSTYLVFLEPSNLLRVDWILTCLICPALISWTLLPISGLLCTLISSH